ncbi:MULTISPECIES: LysR family transcriptional regulator [unclassified Mesorhizobium]|uniref:LysR family transcriptional regulator n=1 Tax=unclassified Mesorhizobium TaxID=325217 RepID=UPI000F75ECBC|nr:MULTISPECIES: LysR family transcriptional regulator [unclassified Mesorhizobium]AZO68646.1 LysR family transcriptional regulator [Mesorhizobium sp. M6A.T.Cr.TU.016.01.1.1]RUV04047.1 LysR family transcriptional regulator [Mesorhizobium sp. M6A.T.Cr.TU.017.01.1.1]RWN25378.1 MAG: LysR family transcriptional regulator [Mesorhizobium sp.]RWN64657.1 MAG: LysR family transcriptional regulator [Mesorhizobium sp.]RWP52900.1 MAG: LysR family transcriptional regulator [Mesorhizobium sp.]
MSRIVDFEAFMAVVEHGSLTAAARRLNRSLQSISRSLATLEESVGVELVQRTTRRSTPSEAGAAFFHRIKPAIDEINDARLQAANQRSEPSGILRVGAPVLFGPDFVIPVIADYMQMHPQVEVDLQLADGFVDLDAEGLDLAIRIGNLPDSSLRARRLGALRRVVFGSPSYFERRGRPTHPFELSKHSCIVRTSDQRPGEWMFQIEGKPRALKVAGSFRSNLMAPIYAAAVHGLGLGYSPLWQIRHLVDDGRLEVVLSDFEPVPVPMHAVWPEGRSSSAKVRTFLDMLPSRLEFKNL